MPPLLPYGLASPAGKTQNCPLHECQMEKSISQCCPLSRINHQIVSLPSGNCLAKGCSLGCGCFSGMCWVSSTQGEQDAPPWVSVRIRTPRFMASKLLGAVVLFLCCCSDLECVLLRQILENQKTLMPSSCKTCSRLHCHLVFRVNNTVFATKKES